jgi:excisionase family DNA binding protein
VAARPSGKAATTSPSYLHTAEVAELLHVSPKTVSRWAKEGKLPFLKTLGGHRRYPEAEIRDLQGPDPFSGEGDYPSASSAKSHRAKAAAARTASSGRMRSTWVSGSPISGQPQTRVSRPSTGSGVSQ